MNYKLGIKKNKLKYKQSINFFSLITFYLLLFTIYCSLFIVSGCARGTLEIPKTYLVFKLSFLTNVDTQKVGYMVAFNTDTSGGTRGPFINEIKCIDGNYLDSSGQDLGSDIINTNTTSYLLTFAGNSATLTYLNKLADGSIQQIPQPFTTYSIENNIITVNLDPQLLNNPSSFVVNLFTFTLDEQKNIRCVKDGLGTPTSDANILIFNNNLDAFREIQDDISDLTTDEAIFNIEKISVLKTQI